MTDVSSKEAAGEQAVLRAEDRPLGTYPGMTPPARLSHPVAPPARSDGAPLGWLDVVRWLGSLQVPRAVAAWVVSALAWCSVLLGPWFIRQLVDDGIIAGDRRALLGWGVGLIIVSIAAIYLGIMRHRIMTGYRTILRADSVRGASRKIAEIGAPFTQRVAGGEMTTAFSTDLDRLGMLFTSIIPGSTAALTLVGGTVVLVFISPWVAAAAFVGMAITLVVARPISGWFFRSDLAYRDQQGVFNNYTHDTMMGLRILTGVGGKARYADILRTESERLKEKGLHVAGRLAAMVAVVYLMPSMTFVLVVWVGAAVTMRGHISVGELLQAVSTAGALLGPMMMTNVMLRDVPAGITAAKRAAAIFTVTRETHDRPTRDAPEGPAPLHDPTTGVTVEPGVCLGVAAASGKDAEALLERLARFAPEDDDGAPPAAWGGHPITDYPLADVRRRITFGEAHAYFIAGTLRETLTTGEDYTDEQVARAVTAAHADDIVDALPAGLDEHLPAGASTVSGGQRQRLRLARSLLRDSEVLLLMEPTSALDATTESVVAEKIARHREGKTTVVVSASPLVLAHCDRVSFLPAAPGEARTGTHEEMAATHVGYRELVLREQATQEYVAREETR